MLQDLILITENDLRTGITFLRVYPKNEGTCATTHFLIKWLLVEEIVSSFEGICMS